MSPVCIDFFASEATVDEWYILCSMRRGLVLVQVFKRVLQRVLVLVQVSPSTRASVYPR